jgi:hypothetical protein
MISANQKIQGETKSVHKRSEDLPTSPEGFHGLADDGESTATSVADDAMEAFSDAIPVW